MCEGVSVSDSGYGNDDISCMTYDIHVDILLACVFVCATIARALRWGVTLIVVILYWALLTPSWDPLSGTGLMLTSDQHIGQHAG